ncbi:MAG: NifB/NifX family molybdenum-iron cluster-binding protein [Melioribacteraceae bacterium]
MKIAVPTRDNSVDEHFGHCEFYTVFTIENDQIAKSEIIESPQGCGCKSNIAAVLKELGVELMLAGNIGGGAINVLNSQEISVVRGCEGSVISVVNAYINGELTDSGVSCRQHEHHSHGEEGHVCGHNN